jgi:hypothetical protein
MAISSQPKEFRTTGPSLCAQDFLSGLLIAGLVCVVYRIFLVTPFPSLSFAVIWWIAVGGAAAFGIILGLLSSRPYAVMIGTPVGLYAGLGWAEWRMRDTPGPLWWYLMNATSSPMLALTVQLFVIVLVAWCLSALLTKAAKHKSS